MSYQNNSSSLKTSLADANLWLVCLATAASIFMIDLMLPLGIAGGVPYVLVILFSLWSLDKRLTLYLAIICSLLTVIGYHLSPEGGEYWKVITNRSMALFVIWTTAILTMMWKHKEEQLYLVRNRIEQEKIYYATLKGTQHIVNNLLNELQLVYMEAIKHPDFDKETLSLFKDMMQEATKLLKRLSEVEQIDEEHILQAVYPEAEGGRNGSFRTLDFRML